MGRVQPFLVLMCNLEAVLHLLEKKNQNTIISVCNQFLFSFTCDDAQTKLNSAFSNTLSLTFILNVSLFEKFNSFLNHTWASMSKKNNTAINSVIQSERDKGYVE